jgi:hypothetical protein
MLPELGDRMLAGAANERVHGNDAETGFEAKLRDAILKAHGTAFLIAEFTVRHSIDLHGGTEVGKDQLGHLAEIDAALLDQELQKEESFWQCGNVRKILGALRQQELGFREQVTPVCGMETGWSQHCAITLHRYRQLWPNSLVRRVLKTSMQAGNSDRGG